MTTALLIIGAWQTVNLLIILGGLWLLVRGAKSGAVTVAVRKPPTPRTPPEVGK